MLSITSRRNGGSRPRSRRECRSLIAVESSPRMRAADAARLQHHHFLVDALEQVVVEPDLAEFVDQYGGVGQRRVEQQPPQQRRLARAEKSGDQRHRREIGRRLSQARVPWRRSVPASSGSHGLPVSRSAAVQRWPRLSTISVLPVAVDRTNAVPCQSASLSSVVSQNPVRRRHLTHPLASARRRVGVARENTRSGDGVGPVFRSAQNAAQCAHRSSLPLRAPHRWRGDRRAKSSAISFIVTKRTPGWLIMCGTAAPASSARAAGRTRPDGS